MTHDPCEYIFSTNMWPTDARSKLIQHMNQWTSQWTHDPWWPIFDQSLTRWPIVSIVTQSRRRQAEDVQLFCDYYYLHAAFV